MRLMLCALAVATMLIGACSDDGDSGNDASDSDDASAERDPAAPRFCDVYLDFLGDSSDASLDAVVEAADNAEIEELAAIVRDDSTEIGRVLAAVEDLDGIARTRCQVEWTAGAQGAGSTAAAASALFDAIVAGDPIGARNVASANAIAVFEPWEPVTPDPDTGAPAVGEVGDKSFSLVLGPAEIAVCQVETGVVVACQFAE